MPGSHASMVKSMLIKKADPSPWFIKTARGGKRMFKIMVTNDIIVLFKIKNYLYKC